jgi:hypothetical protein
LRRDGRAKREIADAVVFLVKFFVYTREDLGESGNWQPCLKNYLQFVSDYC